MPVKLEWQIVDEDHSPINDELVQGRQSSGCRRWAFVLIVLGLALAVGLGLLWQQIRKKQNDLENELRGVAGLELQKLIAGDLELFMNFQDPDDSYWRISQNTLFDSYQAWANVDLPFTESRVWLGEPLAFTGELDRANVLGDEGWLQVGIECPSGEQTCWQVWRYRWVDDAWRHVAIDKDWLGEEQTLDTTHFHFIYPQRDETNVRELSLQMESWYAHLAALYGFDLSANTSQSLTFTIEFTWQPLGPTSSQFRWLPHKSHWLKGPSLHQVLQTQDGKPNDEVYRALSSFVGEAFIAKAAGFTRLPTDFAAEMWALRAELIAWSPKSLDIPANPTTPGTPLLDALVIQNGEQAVRTLARGLGRWQTLDQALSETGLALNDHSHVYAFLLETEQRLALDNDDARYVRFLDTQAKSDWYARNEFGHRQPTGLGAWVNLPVGPLRVKSVSFRGDVAWAEIERAIPPPCAATQDCEQTKWYQTKFFRQVDGRWLISTPVPDYFGAEQFERAPNLELRYLARDIPHSQGLAERLQPMIERAAADLGVEVTNLVFDVQIGYDSGLTGWPMNNNAPLTQHRFTSPHIAGWLDPPLYDGAFGIIYSLVRALTVMRIGGDAETLDTTDWVVSYSATMWEMARLSPEYTHLTQWPHINPTLATQVASQSLADFWPPTFSDYTGWYQVWASYRTLVEFLADEYGPEVVPALLGNLQTADDVYELLRGVTGDDAEQIEQAWQAWVLTVYAGP